MKRNYISGLPVPLNISKGKNRRGSFYNLKEVRNVSDDIFVWGQT